LIGEWQDHWSRSQRSTSNTLPNRRPTMKRPRPGLEDSLKCEICWERDSRFICPFCGRHCCEVHFKNGRCSICQITTCEICGVNLAVGRCDSCQRIICDACQAKFDGARRYCKLCAATAHNEESGLNLKGGPSH